MPEFKERINVAPLAKKYREEGYPPGSPSFDEFGALPLANSGEARAMWAQYKPEMYAIGAIFADRAVRFAYEQRDIDKTVLTIAETKNPFSPFLILGSEIKQEVISSINWNCEQIEKGKEPRLLSAYKRLKTLIILENELKPQVRYAVRQFLEGGINTAVDTMSNSLDVIVELVGGIENPQRIVSIAENSFPLIAKFASGHGEVVLDVLEGLKQFPLIYTPFNPEYFALEDRDGKEKLVISEKGKDRVESIIGIRDFEEYRSDTPVVGCLAMVNFGDGSAVKRMWDWHLDVVQAMAPRFRPGRADK